MIDCPLSSHRWIHKRKIDNTLFLLKQGEDLFIVQVYVDDIIFGGTNDLLGVEFAQLMNSEFEMSMMGELNFFLGLQIKQTSVGISIHHTSRNY